MELDQVPRGVRIGMRSSVQRSRKWDKTRCQEWLEMG